MAVILLVDPITPATPPNRLSPGLERSSVRLEQGSSQFVPANNMNVDSLSSRSASRSSRPGLMGNERREDI